MERFNGYLDLTKYYQNLKTEKQCDYYRLIVDGYIRQSEYDDRHYWLKINEEMYYFKPTIFPYQEIISYHIATMLGYNACFYDLATFSVTKDKIYKGVISKSYHKTGARYISGMKILEEYYKAYPDVVNDMGLTNAWEGIYEGPYVVDMNNLEIIWQALEYRYADKKVNIEALMNDLVDRYILAILLRSYDFSSYNWELEEIDNAVSVCPLTDNELAFYNEKTTISFSTSFKDSEKNVKESLKLFLTRSSEEFVDLFVKKFYEFDYEMLLKAIVLTENQVNTKIPEEEKKDIIANYLLNQKEVTEVLKELKLTNRGR